MIPGGTTYHRQRGARKRPVTCRMLVLAGCLSCLLHGCGGATHMELTRMMAGDLHYSEVSGLATVPGEPTHDALVVRYTMGLPSRHSIWGSDFGYAHVAVGVDERLQAAEPLCYHGPLCQGNATDISPERRKVLQDYRFPAGDFQLGKRLVREKRVVPPNLARSRVFCLQARDDPSRRLAHQDGRDSQDFVVFPVWWSDSAGESPKPLRRQDEHSYLLPEERSQYDEWSRSSAPPDAVLLLPSEIPRCASDRWKAVGGGLVRLPVDVCLDVGEVALIPLVLLIKTFSVLTGLGSDH